MKFLDRNSSETMSKTTPEGYPLSDWLLLIAAIVVFTAAIFFNSLILVILRRKQLKTTTFRFIAHQTVTEILYCVISLISHFICWSYIVESWWSMSVVCALVNVSRDLSLAVSTFLVSVISYDRYRKLYRPLSGEINTKLWTSVTWLLAFGMTSLSAINKGSFIFFKDQMFTCKMIIKLDYEYFAGGYHVMLFWSLTNIVPLIITAFFYYKVIVGRRERKRRKRKKSMENYNKQEVIKEKRGTTQMLIVLIAWHFIVALPVCILAWIKVLLQTLDIRNRCAQEYVMPPEMIVFTGLYFLGSIVVNPFIILYYNPDCKQEAYKLLKVKCLVESNAQSFDLRPSDGSSGIA